MQYNKKALLFSIICLGLSYSFDSNASKAVAVLKAPSRLESIDTNLEHLSNIMVSGLKVTAMLAVPVALYFGGNKLLNWMQQGKETHKNTEEILKTQQGHGAILHQHGEQLTSIQNVQIAHGSDLTAIRKDQKTHAEVLHNIQGVQHQHTASLRDLHGMVADVKNQQHKIAGQQKYVVAQMRNLRLRVASILKGVESVDGRLENAHRDIQGLRGDIQDVRADHKKAVEANQMCHVKTQQELSAMKEQQEKVHEEILNAVSATEQNISSLVVRSGFTEQNAHVQSMFSLLRARKLIGSGFSR